MLKNILLRIVKVLPLFRIIKLCSMKSSELHRYIKKCGWKFIGAEGSHYMYEKEDRKYPVPFHGSKEIGEGLRKKIVKEMGL